MAGASRLVPALLLTALATAASAQKLVYPDQVSSGPGPPVVDCDPEDTFCDRVPNYPEQMIRRRVNASAFQVYRRRQLDQSSILSRRRPIDGDTDEVRVCEVRRQLLFPKAAKDPDGIWRFLINDDGRYRQPVAIEKCRTKNSACTAISDGLGPGFKTRCDQIYVTKLMMAFDHNSLEAYPDQFKFPVACVCYVKNRFFPPSSP